MKNVTPINIAISKHESINQLAVPVLNGKLMVGIQAHLNFDIGNHIFDNVDYKYFNISSTPLEKLINNYSINKIDFTKVDTEGFDSMVLASERKTIIKYKPIMRV